MRIANSKTNHRLWFTTILLSTLLLGCHSDNNGNNQPPITPLPSPPTATVPSVSSVTPIDAATEVLIGTSISATFSEAMDGATINDQSFVLSTSSQAVTGSVNLDAGSLIATFVPTTTLSSSTTYTATISVAATSAAGEVMANPFVWHFTTDIAADTTAPTVTTTNPVANAVAIARNSNISADFSEALNPDTVNINSFTVSNGGTPVLGVVSYTGTSATFNPSEDLAASVLYTATLTTEINDLAVSPNALAANYVWSFTTESAPTTPTVTLTNPLDTEVNVAINHNVVATFSEAMAAASINISTFTLSDANLEAVVGTVSLDVASNAAMFLPNADFSADTSYTATITTGVISLNGVPLANDYIWHFTTVPPADITAPTVVSTNPADLAIDFPINRNIVVEFSEGLSPSTVNNNSFIVSDGTTAVTGTVSYAGASVSFDPSENLASNTLYTATLTTMITDLATPANPMTSDYIWHFTTNAAAAAGPAPVNLRTAGNFVILTKTGTTNIHSSAIVGNLGASPITAAAMDNVFCNEITGTIYGSDAAYTGNGDVTCFAGAAPDNTLVANAILDMGTAYNDAAGRTLPDFTELFAGDISGQTLVPGLYKWSSSLLIATDVTLSGSTNDVWIFQVAGDINQASGSRIILADGAQAKNIFWQVEGGSGVSIDTTAHFEGVILAQKAISVKTGASVNGRLLAHTAVTLDQNAVSQPAQ